MLNRYELMGLTKEEADVFIEIEQYTGYDFTDVASRLMHDRYWQPIGDLEDIWLEMEMEAAKPWAVAVLWLTLAIMVIALL